ncbi:MAG: twin-arginine translocase TatA/TatE family subunit [Actinomycetota bacterium]|jgi:sec-independent protein translocase protein TatA|nr:twin-arginine translocase TatA/TatE family subunit [Actinomycetota bacterium]
MPSIGPLELIILLLVVLLLFGSTRLPKLARSMGEASREFKKGISDREKEQAEADVAKAAADEKVTMSRAELDALLADREAQTRKDAPPSA